MKTDVWQVRNALGTIVLGGSGCPANFVTSMPYGSLIGVKSGSFSLEDSRNQYPSSTQRANGSSVGPCPTPALASLGGVMKVYASRKDAQGTWTHDAVCVAPSLYTSIPTDTSWFYAWPFSSTQPGKAQDVYFSLKTVGPSEALRAYTPRMMYDSQERTYADGVNAAILLPTTQYRTREPDLVDAGSYLLAAGTEAGSPPAPLLTLASIESGGVGSFLDFGSTRGVYQSGLSYRGRVKFPQAKDKVYGRVVAGQNGARYLQFHLWYVYNDASAIGAFNHEGDWEFAQVRVDADYLPIDATFARHGKPHTCPWSRVSRARFGVRPDAYIALGRHATYFGPHNDVQGLLGSDTANGNGYRVVPGVIATSSVPAVFSWPGRWGSTIDGRQPDLRTESDSPFGPQKQAQWGAAQSLTDGAVEGCDAPTPTLRTTASRRAPETKTSRSGTIPPPPTLAARLAGNRLRVSFRTGASAVTRRILLTVRPDRPHTSSIGGRVVPLDADGRGTVTIALPRGQRRLVVEASVFGPYSRSALGRTRTRIR